jgi:hypothetical protein
MTLALPKDVTGALRARRYRRRQKANGINPGVAVTTPEMCALAARLGDGRATPGDLKLAERLIMALVNRLPPDSGIAMGGRTVKGKAPAPMQPGTE